MSGLLQTKRSEDAIISEFYTLAFTLKATNYGVTMGRDASPCMQWHGIDRQVVDFIYEAFLSRPFGDHWRYMNGGETVVRPDGLVDFEIQWWPTSIRVVE